MNTELPSPATGTLSKILIPEGGQVEVFKAMGLIEPAAGASKEPAAAPTAPQASVAPSAPTPVPAPEPLDVEGSSNGRKFYTPVVRSIARQNGISDEQLATIVGTGEGGRVTKKDMEGYLAAGPASAPPPTAPALAPKPAVPARSSVSAGPDQELVPLAGLRKMIADAMVRSSQVPTVSTVTQVDVTNMVHFREKNKETFQETYGVKLTYTPFFIKALSETLIEFPLANSSLTADNQILKTRGVHIGIAVALGAKGDEGLIVPVIRDCDHKTLIDIARDLDELVKKVKGGTFTLTNPGTYGALLGTPMINAPQAGILGTYSISKQPVIVDDMIAIRSIMHLVLTYDHRLIDGLVAGKFLAGVRDRLQKFDFFR